MNSHQPGLPVTGWGPSGELVAGERMAEQHGVGALGIERAVGLVGEREGPERDAAIELERLVPAELDAQAGLHVLRRGFALGHCGHQARGSARPRPAIGARAGTITESGSDSCDWEPKVNVLFDFGTLSG